MPNNPTVIAITADGEIDFGDSVGVTIPVSAILTAVAGEPNTRGMVLWNAKKTVRIQNVTDVDGKPLEVTLSLYAHRAPKDADEADRLVAAQNLAVTKKDKREVDEANKREREIKRATEITESALMKGVQIAAAASTADKVRDALGLLDALKPILDKPKALGQ